MLLQKMIGAASGALQPIQYVGATVGSRAGTTSTFTVSLSSLTGGIASLPAAGDLVIIYFGTASVVDRDLVIGSGFTELVELNYTNSGYTGTNLVVAYKFMGPTPDTSISITGGTLATTDAGGHYVSVWRNVNVATPFDVTRTTFDGRFGADLDPPSITPITSGAFIVSGGVGGHLQSVQTFTSSDLSDFRTSGADDNYDVTVGGGYKEWTSGAFNPTIFGFTGTGGNQFDSACGVTLALRPE